MARRIRNSITFEWLFYFKLILSYNVIFIGRIYRKYRLDKYFQRTSVAKSVIFLRITEVREYLCTSVFRAAWTKYTKKFTNNAELTSRVTPLCYLWWVQYQQMVLHYKNNTLFKTKRKNNKSRYCFYIRTKNH